MSHEHLYNKPIFLLLYRYTILIRAHKALHILLKFWYTIKSIGSLTNTFSVAV